MGARPALAVLSDFDFSSDRASDGHALDSQVFTVPIYNSVQVDDSDTAAAGRGGQGCGWVKVPEFLH